MQASPVLKALHDEPLLGQLAGPVLSQLLAHTQEEVFAVGDTLVRHEDRASSVLLIVEGEVIRVMGETSTVMQGPGLLVGQEAAGLERYVCTVSARTPVRAWRIPRAAIAHTCTLAPGLAGRLIQSIYSAPLPSATRIPFPQNMPETPVIGMKSIVGWLLATVVPLLVYGLGSAHGLGMQSCVFMAIFAAVITLWVFSLVDDFLPPLLALVYLLFAGIAPANVILSSFGSPTLLTLLGVFALASALTVSGLSNRLLLGMLLKMPDKPLWHQTTLLLYGLTLSLGTPSGNNRMALLLPVFQDMRQGLRLAEGGAAVSALFTATYGGAMLFSSALATSKSVTISVFGFLPLHLQDYYSGLFWLMGASLASIMLLALHLLASSWIFSEAQSGKVSRPMLSDRLRLLGPMTIAEKVTAGGFCLFFLGSLTTGVHHVSPAAIAGSVLVCFLVTGIMTKHDFQKNIDWPMIFFLIATDGLIRVMDDIGLSHQLASSIGGAHHFVQGSTVKFLLFSLLVVLALRLFLPIPAGMLLSALILMPIAQTEGINLWICIFSIAVFSDIWFFTYQNSIYMIAAAAGVEKIIDTRKFMRHNMIMNLARVLVVFASLPLWQWMGIA